MELEQLKKLKQEEALTKASYNYSAVQSDLYNDAITVKTMQIY